MKRLHVVLSVAADRSPPISVKMPPAPKKIMPGVDRADESEYKGRLPDRRGSSAHRSLDRSEMR